MAAPAEPVRRVPTLQQRGRAAAGPRPRPPLAAARARRRRARRPAPAVRARRVRQAARGRGCRAAARWRRCRPASAAASRPASCRASWSAPTAEPRSPLPAPSTRRRSPPTASGAPWPAFCASLRPAPRTCALSGSATTPPCQALPWRVGSLLRRFCRRAPSLRTASAGAGRALRRAGWTGAAAAVPHGTSSQSVRPSTTSC